MRAGPGWDSTAASTVAHTVGPHVPGVNCFTPDPDRVAPEQVVVQRHRTGASGDSRAIPEECSRLRGVHVQLRLVSRDGRRELLMVEAPDAEVVRELVRLVWPDDEVQVWTARNDDRLATSSQRFVDVCIKFGRVCLD